MTLPSRNMYGRYTPDQEAAISDYEEGIAEECVRLRPIVLEERISEIRAALAVPGSNVADVTHEAWFNCLVQNQLETLAQVAASGARDEDIGRAFRVIIDQAIGCAAKEGLDDAVDERARGPRTPAIRVGNFFISRRR